MNFATFTPIDLKANSSHLHEFLRLLQAAMEHRQVGSSSNIDAQLMASFIANGVLGAVLAVRDGAPVGVQIWEHGKFWFDNHELRALRIQFLEGEYNTVSNHVQFLQEGNMRMTNANAGAQVINVIDVRDQIANIAPNCGFKTYAVAYEP